VTGAPVFGVLLTNLGSPAAATPRAVRAYLREFLADRRVIDLPRFRWWLIRQLFILPIRPHRSARLYRKIWTNDGSPLLATTRRIGRALETALTRASGLDIPVSVGMRYGEPSIAAGLGRLVDARCPRVLVLPLYPQYSATTTASTMDAVAAASGRLKPAPEIRSTASYHVHPAYIGALAASVRAVWGGDGAGRKLLMSFHGLPKRYADQGDPYPLQCGRTAKAMAEELELAPGRWHMAYQSRFGREPWLRPYLDDRLTRWGRQGLAGVDVICPGFAADCLETLEEVAMTGRHLFESAGGKDFRYIPALNDHPRHIEALTAVAVDTAGDWLDQKTRSR
jgi:ferrochelatase